MGAEIGPYLLIDMGPQARRLAGTVCGSDQM
jgi:hypothetical protein